MKNKQRKTNLKKKYVIGCLLPCVLVIFAVFVILLKKNKKGGDVVAVYVKEQGSDYIFTSQDGGLSWMDENIPGFFMVTQDEKIRQDKGEITVTIQNNSDAVVTYGEGYRLYRWSKNMWVPCKAIENSYIPQLLYVVQPGDFREMKCNWRWYEYGHGRYLLTEEVTWEKDMSTWDLSVEFILD